MGSSLSLSGCSATRAERALVYQRAGARVLATGHMGTADRALVYPRPGAPVPPTGHMGTADRTHVYRRPGARVPATGRSCTRDRALAYRRPGTGCAGGRACSSDRGIPRQHCWLYRLSRQCETPGPHPYAATSGHSPRGVRWRDFTFFCLAGLAVTQPRAAPTRGDSADAHARSGADPARSDAERWPAVSLRRLDGTHPPARRDTPARSAASRSKCRAAGTAGA
jgi:hypothetical protein